MPVRDISLALRIAVPVETALDPDDVDQAIDQMRRELALRGLRRRLLHPALDARDALAISSAAVELQLG